MYRTRESERAHHTWLVLALDRHKGSYSDRKRALKWVLLVTVPRTVLDDATNLAMGPGNDAGASTDCVRQARPQAVLRASAAHSSGRSSSVANTHLQFRKFEAFWKQIHLR